jgi:hypothetical protein
MTTNSRTATSRKDTKVIPAERDPEIEFTMNVAIHARATNEIVKNSKTNP